MGQKNLSFEDVCYHGDSVLLKAFDNVLYNPLLDDEPKGIINEMEDLELILIKKDRMVLTSTGKRALRAGGIKQFYNGNEVSVSPSISQRLPLYFFFFLVVVILLYLAYQIFFIDSKWDGLSFLVGF